MNSTVEIWENRWGDTAIFLDEGYVIYDKCDRLEAEVIAIYKQYPNETIEDFKKRYYDNGFRPQNNDEEHKGDFNYSIKKYENMIRRQNND